MQMEGGSPTTSAMYCALADHISIIPGVFVGLEFPKVLAETVLLKSVDACLEVVT